MLDERLLEHCKKPAVRPAAALGVPLHETVVGLGPPAVDLLGEHDLRIDEIPGLHAPEHQQPVRPGIRRLPDELLDSSLPVDPRLLPEREVGIDHLAGVPVLCRLICHLIGRDRIAIPPNTERVHSGFEVPAVPGAVLVVPPLEQMPQCKDERF